MLAQALRATARDGSLDAAARADAQLKLAGLLAFSEDDSDISEAVKLLDGEAAPCRVRAHRGSLLGAPCWGRPSARPHGSSPDLLMCFPLPRIRPAAAAINTRHMPEEDHAECLFLRAVGLMRLGRHSECREALREMTDRHPAFMRGVALRDVFASHVSSQGRAGLVVILGGAIALGIAAWWFWPRGGMASDASASGSSAGRRYSGGYSHRPSSGLRGGGYSFGAPLRH